MYLLSIFIPYLRILETANEEIEGTPRFAILSQGDERNEFHNTYHTSTFLITETDKNYILQIWVL